jgi:hypothetical protein
MSLSRSLSEKNEHVKFEKSLGMSLSHLSNPTPSKVQRGKPPPLFLLFLGLQVARQWCSADYPEKEEGVFRGGIFRGQLTKENHLY